MKRTFSFLLILGLLLSLISAAALSASAEELNLDGGEPDMNIDVPDDAWDGAHSVFNGKDGSVTTVFDNGSVITTYKDGSKEGVDYKGNQHNKTKDGTYSIRGTDGSVATQYEDGRMSYTGAGTGKTTTYNTDGSFTEAYSSWGVSVDYDFEGQMTGIGFTDSNERLGVDENGDYRDGTVKGKKGEVFTVDGDSMYLTAADGRKAEYKYTGGDGTTESYKVSHPDGYLSEWEIVSKWGSGQNGEMEKSVENSGNIQFPDGTRFDYDEKWTFDKDGVPVMIDNNVSQFTCSDGSTLWRDHNSKAFEFNDPNTGAKLIIDSNGNLLVNKSEEIDFTANYDESGNLVSADIKWSDGAHQVCNPDGTGSFTLPDGTKYESDGKGNIYKNGVLVKNLSDDKITTEDICGTWTVNVNLGDIESPLVDGLVKLFDGIFGEGAGDDIVERSYGDEGIDSTQTMYIEEDGNGNFTVTVTSDDEVSVYTGKLKGDTLKLKLQSQSSGEGVQIPVNKLELKFAKSDGVTVMSGSFRINEVLVKAVYSYYGVK